VNDVISPALVRAVHGDLDAFLIIRRVPHEQLREAAETIAPLVLRGEDVVAVLRALRDRAVAPELARSWASFVRRGYIAESERAAPVHALSIDYEPRTEPEIISAIGRLDELGDDVDGVMEDAEMDESIHRLLA
jgi:hypothetical protein